MLRAENQHITSTPVHCPHHRIDNRPYEALTCATQLTIDIMGSLAGKDGDSTDIGGHTAINAQWFPGIALLVFSNAVAVLPWMAQATLVEHTGDRPAHVH